MNFDESFKKKFNHIRRTSLTCALLALILAVVSGLLMSFFPSAEGTPLEKMLSAKNLLSTLMLASSFTCVLAIIMYFAAHELSFPKFKADDCLLLKPSRSLYTRSLNKSSQVTILGILENGCYLTKNAENQNNSMSFAEVHSYYYLPKKN